MADGQRRMLFDIRGRRRHVVKVVYGILAVLMGASLFLVVGPVNIGSLLGTADEVNRSADIFDEQAERTEERLRKDPTNEDILLSLTRVQINAGRAKSEVDPTTGEQHVGVEARAEYEKAGQTWDRYLKVVKGQPNSSVASLIASSSFSLAQSSRSYAEAIEYLEEAATAQQLAAKSRPNVGTLTTLAAYEYLAGDKAAGAKAGQKALSMAETKAERKSIEKQLTALKKQSKEIQKAKKEAEKAEKGKGKETLENPLGGLGGGSGPAVTPTP
jgi:tetratricopeptide (TPR) repeat protein